MTQPSRRPLILGNWKMNTTLDEAVALASAAGTIADAHPSVDVGILPPAIWLVPLHKNRHDASMLKIGAQDASPRENGACTGELSVAMLAPWCDYILAGHSERRQHHHETDEIIRAKLDAIVAIDCIPVLAVGESEPERDAGIAARVVARQLDGALAGRPAADLTRIVVAYEPVWAIGTGKSASAQDAREMAKVIRGWLAQQDQQAADTIRILYGGSMKPDNATEILANPDIDGGLIGGASLSANDFEKIVVAASN